MSLESAEKALGAKVFWTLAEQLSDSHRRGKSGTIHTRLRSEIGYCKKLFRARGRCCRIVLYGGASRREADEKGVGLLNRWIPMRGLLK